MFFIRFIAKLLVRDIVQVERFAFGEEEVKHEARKYVIKHKFADENFGCRIPRPMVLKVTFLLHGLTAGVRF